jgi:hypothetical protein
MTGDPPLPDDESDETPDRSDPDGSGQQNVEHAPISARVPPNVARGVFSTGVVVFNGPSECVLDFVVRLGSPHMVVARVVITPLVLGQFIAALNENLSMYTGRFGTPPALPAMPGQQTNSIEDLYGELKLADEMLSGVYANAVMIGHTPAEFWFDFITNFYPRSAVSCRVYMTAQQIRGVLETLSTSFQAWQKRMEGGEPEPPPHDGNDE